MLKYINSCILDKLAFSARYCFSWNPTTPSFYKIYFELTTFYVGVKNVKKNK